MPIDRTLTIQVSTTSNWNVPGMGANVSYSLTGSDPAMPNAISDPQGDLNLHDMPVNSGFTDNIDITFDLSAAMTDQNGNPLPARWALATEGSGSYDTPEGFCWFCAGAGDTQPISAEGMATIRNSDTSVTINDDASDNNIADYFFCLGLVVLMPAPHFITIEPIISGKGKAVPPAPPLIMEQY